jgi:hypothetical protein
MEPKPTPLHAARPRGEVADRGTGDFNLMRLLAMVAGGLLAASPAVLLPARAASDTQRVLDAARAIPPITFVVAHGGANACGVGCDSWIAAEGLIDDGAAARLRAVLDRLGARKLPVFFYSPGGDTRQGLAIGRLLRKRGLTAGVAVTVAADCVGAHEVEDCRKPMRAPQPPEAALLMDGAACNSACAYAALGATRREIAPTAQLGVHSGYSYLSWASPKATARQRALVVERGRQRIAGEVKGYLAAMGIAPDLYRIVSETKFESLHVLTRAELFALGIDTREVADSGWHFSELHGSSLGSTMLTTVVVRDSAASPDFSQMALTVSCGAAGSGHYVVSTIARLTDASASARPDIRIGNDADAIWLRADGARQRTSRDNKTFEIRTSEAPRTLVEKLLLASPAIAFAAQPVRLAAADQSGAPAATPIPHPLSGVAVVASLKTLAGHCE